MGEVFGRYTDTAGNYHWCDTETGHHMIPAQIVEKRWRGGSDDEKCRMLQNISIDIRNLQYYLRNYEKTDQPFVTVHKNTVMRLIDDLTCIEHLIVEEV